MREGDVFFHNDVYESEGGIGHLPDLCVTVPVFSRGRGRRVRAGLRPPRRHRRRRARLDAEQRAHASSRRACRCPPIKLWDAGVPNQAALRIMTRNSRMPDSLAADLDAECSACLMGARRLAELFARYGRDTIEAAFDAILDATTETYRREILGKIPDGTYVWEDYAEHDGVDEPQLHTQRITLTKTVDRRPRPRRRRPEAASSTSPAPARRPRARSTTAATTSAATSSRSGSRRSCATSPTPPSGWPSSTSTRASCRSSRCASPRRARCSRRSTRRRPTPAPSSSCGCSACWPAWSPRRSTAGCRPTRRRSATPASTARTATATTT